MKIKQCHHIGVIEHQLRVGNIRSGMVAVNYVRLAMSCWSRKKGGAGEQIVYRVWRGVVEIIAPLIRLVFVHYLFIGPNLWGMSNHNQRVISLPYRDLLPVQGLASSVHSD